MKYILVLLLLLTPSLGKSQTQQADKVKEQAEKVLNQATQLQKLVEQLMKPDYCYNKLKRSGYCYHNGQWFPKGSMVDSKLCNNGNWVFSH